MTPIRLGEVRSTPKGLAVVRVGQFDPKRFRRGLPVVKEDGTKVGVTYDIIGNVESPYLIVRLEAGASLTPSDKLYVLIQPARPPRRSRGRGLRRR